MNPQEIAELDTKINCRVTRPGAYVDILNTESCVQFRSEDRNSENWHGNDTNY